MEPRAEGNDRVAVVEHQAKREARAGRIGWFPQAVESAAVTVARPSFEPDDFASFSMTWST
jgi:hypothetical protein